MVAQPLDEESIFKLAAAIPAGDTRGMYLEQVCGHDDRLRQRIERLLSAHDEAPQFLESSMTGLAATLQLPPTLEQVGARIGPYKLIESIGEGGMGIVYMALQSEPVRRKVALKIIKPGMDTREVTARFAAEEQALALMDHPNIAHVLDAGTTESGRPYFVMELVNGVPITQYCDDNNLPTRERLELFAMVCGAVQHAHQKGIIHRDIKPSNILVTLHDGVPVPKIIDFGIAKATSGALTNATLATAYGQMLGTPLYMSPEQAERSGLDVDTRSDIYSLGVLLYELLTGSTPFERGTLKELGLDELRRVIREQEPPRPSTRISTMGQAATTVSEHRRTTPVELSSTLRHELDWIVMKALEKDRTRRYETAADFARDIQRYLNDEPVEACPPSTAYRLKKFVRRNRKILAATSAVVISLVAVLVTLVFLSRAAREVAETRGELAERRLRVQQKITDALAEVTRLRGSKAVAEQGDESVLTSAGEQLQLAIGLAEGGAVDPELIAPLQALEQELDTEREMAAQVKRDRALLETIDGAWRLLANVDFSESAFTNRDATPVLRQALHEYGIRVSETPVPEVVALIKSRPPEVQQSVLEALNELAAISRPMIGVALRFADDKTFVTSIAPDTPAARDGRLAPGDELVGIGEGPEGVIVNIRSLPEPDVRKLLTGKPGSTVRLEVIPQGKLESVIYELQRDSAGAWLQSVVEMADNDPWRGKRREAAKIKDLANRLEALTHLSAEVDVSAQPVRVITGLADELQALGQHLGAPDARSAATTLLRKTQAAYPDDLWANASLANVLRASNPPQMEEAVRYYTAAIALRPQSAGLHLNMGIALSTLGRVEEADAEYRTSLRIAPGYSAPRCNLVDSLIEQERCDEAEALAREAVERWPNAATYSNLGRALTGMSKNAEASEAYREALRLDPTMIDGHSRQAMELFGAGKTEAALEKFREVVAMDPTMAGSHYNLGRALGLMGRLDEACEAYRTCLKLDPNEIAALTNLTHTLREQGRQEEAVQACRDVLAQTPDSSIVHDILAGCLLDCGREDEAVMALRESIRLYPRPARLNLAYTRLAELLAQSENPAVRNLPEAIALATQAVEMEPEEELVWETMGIVRFENQEWQASIEAFQKSERFVDTRKYGREYTRSPVAWANNYLHRAMAHWQLGQVDEARAWFVVGERILGSVISDEERALLRKPAEMLGMSLDLPRSIPETIAAFRATLQTDPDGFVRNNSLAWLLATAADVQYREPALALAHAQRAVQLMPQDTTALHTLGVACYRNGQWNEAIVAVHRSIELAGVSDSHALILAMAHWQRGEQDEARRWYDGVVKSLKGRGNSPRDEELESLRKEAEELLGIPK